MSSPSPPIDLNLAQTSIEAQKENKDDKRIESVINQLPNPTEAELKEILQIEKEKLDESKKIKFNKDLTALRELLKQNNKSLDQPEQPQQQINKPLLQSPNQTQHQTQIDLIPKAMGWNTEMDTEEEKKLQGEENEIIDIEIERKEEESNKNGKNLSTSRIVIRTWKEKKITSIQIINAIKNKYKDVLVQVDSVPSESKDYVNHFTKILADENNIISKALLDQGRLLVEHTVALILPYQPLPRAPFCTNCGLPGHSLSRCDRPSICIKCGNKDHKTIECKEEKTVCINCKEEHDPRSMKCKTMRTYTEEYRKKTRLNNQTPSSTSSSAISTSTSEEDSKHKRPPTFSEVANMRGRQRGRGRGSFGERFLPKSTNFPNKLFVTNPRKAIDSVEIREESNANINKSIDNLKQHFEEIILKQNSTIAELQKQNTTLNKKLDNVAQEVQNQGKQIVLKNDNQEKLMHKVMTEVLRNFFPNIPAKPQQPDTPRSSKSTIEIEQIDSEESDALSFVEHKNKPTKTTNLSVPPQQKQNKNRNLNPNLFPSFNSSNSFQLLRQEEKTEITENEDEDILQTEEHEPQASSATTPTRKKRTYQRKPKTVEKNRSKSKNTSPKNPSSKIPRNLRSAKKKDDISTKSLPNSPNLKTQTSSLASSSTEYIQQFYNEHSPIEMENTTIPLSKTKRKNREKITKQLTPNDKITPTAKRVQIPDNSQPNSPSNNSNISSNENNPTLLE
jgi:hypothetical protein